MIIHFFGINRSGIHAIAYWIVGQSGLDIQRKTGYKAVNNILYTHENELIKYMRDKIKSNKIAHRCKFVMNIRDPFNHFASMLARPRFCLPFTSESKETQLYKQGKAVAKAKNRKMINAIPLWKAYAREALGFTKILPAKFIFVNYNEWFKNKNYRKKLANKLSLRFTDKNIQKVGREGAGSSFDDLIYDGQAQQMNVFSRWKKFAEFRWYRNMFDAEIIKLSRKLFGDEFVNPIFNLFNL